VRSTKSRPVIRAVALLGLLALASPPRAGAQASPWNDSLLDRMRALARSVPGERPRSLHVLKIAESSRPAGSPSSSVTTAGCWIPSWPAACCGRDSTCRGDRHRAPTPIGGVLLFDGTAQEAAHHYVSIFGNSKIQSVTR
jgi:hypothetical protein